MRIFLLPSSLLISFLISAISLLASSHSYSQSYEQCEAIAQQCKQSIMRDQPAMGGSVQQVLWFNQTMQLPLALQSNSRYRLAACAEAPEQTISFSILNESEDHYVADKQDAYTTVVTKASVNATIELSLQPELAEPVCAAFVIGVMQDSIQD